MAHRRTSLALYRALLRAAARVHKSDTRGLIFTAARQDPSLGVGAGVENYDLCAQGALKWESYGLGSIFPPGAHAASPVAETDNCDNDNNENNEDNEGNEDKDRAFPSAMLYGSDIRKMIQKNFRKQIQCTSDSHFLDIDGDGDGAAINKKLDLGFKALSSLSLLTKQSARSCTHTTYKGNRIKVRITITAFFEEQLPSTSEFNYHYRVQAENIGESAIQLCGRHWIFMNAKGGEESVVAKYAQGVVGATPVIPAGAGVQYWSQCFLSTESGTMEGNFLFLDLDTEELFEATIDKCSLFPM